MSRYFHTERGWVGNPLHQDSALTLAQYEVGSVESRAAARALLATSREEPLLIFPGDGSVYFHERCFQPGETREHLTRVIERLKGTSVL